MKVSDFQLNDFEIALGVTLDDVAAALPSVLIRDGFVIVESDLPPAIAGAVARCALGCDAVEFDGLLAGCWPRYVRSARHVGDVA